MITALDLHYFIGKLQGFAGGKIDQIYCPSKRELILQMHLPGVGKKLLFIRVPDAIWVADAKPEIEKLSGFCRTLRKYLGNARLREVKQLGFERIIEFIFEKEKKYSLVFEMFSKGNIILVQNKKIIAAVEFQKWAARTIRPKEEYKWPVKEFNFLELKLTDLKQMLAKTSKESVVKALAIELGLGGVYSEEACAIAGIDKNKKPDSLDADEIKKLFNAFSELRKKKVGDDILYRFGPGKEVSAIEKRYLKKLEEIERIIAEQRAKIKGHEAAETENKRKAEIIYENYNLIKDIVSQIKEARKKYSWQEIKEKLKGHKLIKEVNIKDKKVILDLK